MNHVRVRERRACFSGCEAEGRVALQMRANLRIEVRVSSSSTTVCFERHLPLMYVLWLVPSGRRKKCTVLSTYVETIWSPTSKVLGITSRSLGIGSRYLGISVSRSLGLSVSGLGISVSRYSLSVSRYLDIGSRYGPSVFRYRVSVSRSLGIGSPYLDHSVYRLSVSRSLGI